MPDTTYPTPAELEAQAQDHERIGLTSEAAGLRIPISDIVDVRLPSGVVRPMPVAQAIDYIAHQDDQGRTAILCNVNPYQAQDIHHAVCDLRRVKQEGPRHA